MISQTVAAIGALLFSFPFCAHAAPPEFSLPPDLSRLADSCAYPRLYTLNEPEVIDVARRLTSLPIPERVAALAFLQVGEPYQGGALGEEAPPDTGPFIRYDVTDCVILNLVSVVLAHVDSPGWTPRAAMAIAGYFPPRPPTYETRLHFTSDRLARSPWFSDVTAVVAKGRVKRTTVTLNRKRDGSRWLPLLPPHRRTVTWVPAAKAALLPRLPEVTGVAFVKEKSMADGLDVLHEGILYRGDTVVHASSRAGQVITEPFSVMLRRYDGVIFFAYR